VLCYSQEQPISPTIVSILLLDPRFAYAPRHLKSFGNWSRQHGSSSSSKQSSTTCHGYRCYNRDQIAQPLHAGTENNNTICCFSDEGESRNITIITDRHIEQFSARYRLGSNSIFHRLDEQARQTTYMMFCSADAWEKETN
jgi:hypothetical protein